MTPAPLPAGTPLLEVDELRTAFRTARGLVKAVDGISFRLDHGRTMGVVGESGSGKTVLAKSIMGLLPPRNVDRSGRVVFEGRDLVSMPPPTLRRIWGREMTMVFQDPMTSLNPVMRVGAQVAEPLRHHLRMKKGDALAAALELLRSLGIPEAARRMRDYPHQLSGGMRQRVVIAIALACSPKLLLADEPTTALDVTVQAQILNLLQDQQEKRHMAMVLVTHDLGVVAGRTDEIMVMYAGKIVEHAPTHVLFAEPHMPYTEALLNAIPRLEEASHTRQMAIPGRPPDLVDPPPGCRFAPRCAYAQDRCREEEPPLVDAMRPGHRYACWFPVGTVEGKEALARNVQAGVSQSVALVEVRRRKPSTPDAGAADAGAADAGAADAGAADAGTGSASDTSEEVTH